MKFSLAIGSVSSSIWASSTSFSFFPFFLEEDIKGALLAFVVTVHNRNLHGSLMVSPTQWILSKNVLHFIQFGSEAVNGKKNIP